MMEKKLPVFGGAKPKAPTASEWEALAARIKRPLTAPVVDVLVPVYGGFAETMRCIYSVLDCEQKTSFNLLVVNDCSPDPEICGELRRLSSAGLIELHELPENLGFVGACNFGMGLHRDRDVLLLNSDTEVYSDWLDRIRRAAYRNGRTGTVT
ncbi:MAG TPA: glycosyltransferase, partial [Polaromonas sp.]|nr:glycosyltransferase [Polaromonas sp.]